MIQTLILWGMLAFLASFICTVFVKRFAIKCGAVDKPSKSRNIHLYTTARLGGLAIYIAFTFILILALLNSSLLTEGLITYKHYIGIMVGGLVLMIGGYIDDRFELKAGHSIISPLIATIIVIVFGVEIDKLTNPFGGIINLEGWQSDIIVFIWLMVVMYTTKFLDGLDGLATSVSSVGVLMITFLSLTTAYYQSDVALLGVIVFGALIGFLFWNFHPASIFLGEGGSTLVGFLLGVLAIISGGKLATALLVLGIPLLDVVWIIARRFKKGGIKQIIQGDRKHLHHRFVDVGWGQRQIVLFYVLIATVFGASALFLQSKDKVLALVLLAIVMLIAALSLVAKERKHENC